jgi:membrane protease YdiL (CAAX protease family)
MDVKKKTRKKIFTFIALTFLISSIFYLWIASEDTARNVGGFFMWSPGIAAVLTQLIYKDSILSFGWKLDSWKYLFKGIAIALIYSIVIYSFVWITGLGGFQSIPFLNLIIYLTAGLFIACLTALGEEIGWRGFLVPELIKITSPTKTALISGGIWALWHYPLIIFGDYRSIAPLWFQLLTFTLSVIGMGFLTAWLRIKSGSIWPVVIWHGAHNLFIQQVFLDMTFDTGITEFFVDDFGIGLTISFLFIGYVFWRKLSQITFESQ